MGPEINSNEMDIAPFITYDGKYLFFSSSRKIYKSFFEKPVTYDEKIKIMSSPGNGDNDIYWVDAKIIEKLREKIIK